MSNFFVVPFQRQHFYFTKREKMLKLFIFEFFENFFGKSLRKLEVVLAGATFGSGLRLRFFSEVIGLLSSSGYCLSSGGSSSGWA